MINDFIVVYRIKYSNIISYIIQLTICISELPLQIPSPVMLNSTVIQRIKNTYTIQYVICGQVCKRGRIHAITNSWKNNFEIFNSIYLNNDQSSLHLFLHKSIANQGNSLCLLYAGQLAELPTKLDNTFTGIANTTSTPIGREGGVKGGEP